MSKAKNSFRASTLSDTTLRRLRNTPSYFFLIWRWSMWAYAFSELNTTEESLAARRATTYSGHGMTGMHDRALELGGTFSVQSQSAEGVYITVNIPF